MKELFIDNFAGGGGASTGIELAIGKSVDIAINHDPDAISMHKANHPSTKHYCENIWDVDPKQACEGNPVALAWFSPDCKHFSRAKGGKPVDKNIRGLAWVVIRWAYYVRPRVIMLENVPEIQTWGPLGKNNKPIKERAGETFEGFILALTTGLPRSHPAFNEMCDALKTSGNIVFEGVIGQSLDIHWSTLLTADSLLNIVNHLSDSATGKTITLPTTAESTFNAKNDEGAWSAFVATKTNWTFAYA